MNSSPYLLVYNPKSGRGKSKRIAEALFEEISALGEFCKLITGDDRDDAIANLSSEITGAKAIIAIGGDGLVNLVISASHKHEIPIFVVAAGTGNDFYRTHFKSSRPIVEVIKQKNNEINFVDLAEADVSGSIKHYGQVLSAGFDSLVNARANQLKFFSGTFKYIIALLLELPRFKPYSYAINIDGKKREFKAMMVIVANGPTYGGGMKVLPMADPRDGLLDVMILHPVSKFELLKVFPKVFTGAHIKHKQVEVMRGKKVSIFSDAYIYADGEHLGRGDIRVEVIPNSLKILGS